MEWRQNLRGQPGAFSLRVLALLHVVRVAVIETWFPGLRKKRQAVIRFPYRGPRDTPGRISMHKILFQFHSSRVDK